jgi:hypothetical protein
LVHDFSRTRQDSAACVSLSSNIHLSKSTRFLDGLVLNRQQCHRRATTLQLRTNKTLLPGLRPERALSLFQLSATDNQSTVVRATQSPGSEEC